MTNLRFAFFTMCLSLYCLLSGCGDSDGNNAGHPRSGCGPEDASILPAPTGRYCVGTTSSMALVDPSRDEPFTADPDDRREVVVTLFYPVDPGTKGTPAPFTDPLTFEYLVGDYWYPISPHPEYETLPTNSLLDAPLAAGNAAFPILLAAPGLGSITAMITGQIENLVSHGYIVAVTSHPYVSGRTVFPDGRVIVRELAPNEEFPQLRDRLPLVVGDQQFVLDEIERLAANDPTWRGRIDLTHVGAFGHSYGGNTAAELCAQDDRFGACINDDGLFFGKIASQGSTKPILLLLRAHRVLIDPPFVDTTIAAAIAHHVGPFYLAEIEGSTHQTFTDAAFVFSQFPPPAPLESFVGTIAPERGLEIINSYNLAFFDVYLRDQPESVLTDLAERFSEVPFVAE